MYSNLLLAAQSPKLKAKDSAKIKAQSSKLQGMR